MKISAEIKSLHKKAVAARKAAYAPYSKFKVGAALLPKKGEAVLGCNVENASYGGTVCAERIAIFKAVSGGLTKFTDIVVVTDSSTHPAAPCALCLQIMAEFFESDTKIWVADTKKIHKMYRFKDLLPLPFGPRELEKAR